MSQPQGVYHAEAKQKDMKERMLAMFTPEQVDELIADFEQICAHGAGDVYVIFRGGHALQSHPRLYKNFSTPKFT